ncbi:DUF134 domain-containing protein [Maribacter polysaccharolyticus]|uniref:DUF134 domain-containing protein n=1 Tax=Maribacter polysaccharolyticus TaxID=3020831 RepID=UPI00237F9D52|nr:DUF134 domain-containing protein [Maribacter polysaccharolyticus]MDE3741260.1 DUF134 domain-containing protein [Maribacter polysaccharolyticus]
MSRPKTLRKVVAPPNFKGYRPYGTNVEANESVDLLYEEYEAIKLADYDLMNHLEASQLMGISRATFARIYETARRKIAKALVETIEIKTVYGDALLDKHWYVCGDCQTRFTIPKTIKEQQCPLCKSGNIELLNT